MQERGRILLDVMDYLQNPDAAEDEEEATAGGGKDGSAEQDEALPPYPGQKGLEELWNEGELIRGCPAARALHSR